jgi:hypothetical protein
MHVWVDEKALNLYKALLTDRILTQNELSHLYKCKDPH